MWYLSATTEITTKFCLCNVMNYTINEKTYTYTDTCFQDLSSKKTWNNQTLTLGGDLSTDPDSPGVLHEGFVIAGHGVITSLLDYQSAMTPCYFRNLGKTQLSVPRGSRPHRGTGGDALLCVSRQIASVHQACV